MSPVLFLDLKSWKFGCGLDCQARRGMNWNRNMITTLTMLWLLIYQTLDSFPDFRPGISSHHKAEPECGSIHDLTGRHLTLVIGLYSAFKPQAILDLLCNSATL